MLSEAMLACSGTIMKKIPRELEQKIIEENKKV